MHCGKMDERDDLSIHGTEEESDRAIDRRPAWEVISVYSREEAIEDGSLIPYSFTYNRKRYDACFTSGLWEKYKAYPSAIKWMVQRGMKLLAQPDPEDSEFRKLRVILDRQIWVVSDADGLTFLRPQDY